MSNVIYLKNVPKKLGNCLKVTNFNNNFHVLKKLIKLKETI